MQVAYTDTQPPIVRERLALHWTIIGSVLLTASVAQPIVSSQLAGTPPDDLLAPMARYMGDRPLPDEIVALFGGVFANIQYAFAFAALKLVAGGLILYAARKLLLNADWAQKVLQVASYIGMAAFVGIGLFFAYSSFLFGEEMDVPVLLTMLMVAFLPTRFLWQNARSLAAL